MQICASFLFPAAVKKGLFPLLFLFLFFGADDECPFSADDDGFKARSNLPKYVEERKEEGEGEERRKGLVIYCLADLNGKTCKFRRRLWDNNNRWMGENGAPWISPLQLFSAIWKRRNVLRMHGVLGPF